jgi:hypothetical protein
MPVDAASLDKALTIGLKILVVASVPSAKYLNTFTPKKDRIKKIKIHVVSVVDEIAEVIDEKNDPPDEGDPLLRFEDKDSYN